MLFPSGAARGELRPWVSNCSKLRRLRCVRRACHRNRLRSGAGSADRRRCLADGGLRLAGHVGGSVVSVAPGLSVCLSVSEVPVPRLLFVLCVLALYAWVGAGCVRLLCACACGRVCAPWILPRCRTQLGVAGGRGVGRARERRPWQNVPQRAESCQAAERLQLNSLARVDCAKTVRWAC